MDFNKLSANERLAAIGAAVLIIFSLISYGFGLSSLGVLAAIALLVVIFLPQFSPSTSLPGSRGSLMLLTGGIAGVVMVLAFLSLMSILFAGFGANDLFFTIAVVGGVIAAWASWQEFQAEGGKFVLGTPAGGSASAAAAPRTDTTPPPAAPPAAPTDVDDERPASPTV